MNRKPRTADRKRRADLDELAYRLRAEGLSYVAIAERLGVDLSMARRRVIRYERLPNDQAATRKL